MTDLRTALEAIEDIARHRTDDSAWHDVRVIARAALGTPTPDDRDREVERIRTAISEYGVHRFSGLRSGLAAALYDAGLRASGGD